MSNTKKRGHRPAKPGGPITRILEDLKIPTIRELAEKYGLSYTSLRNWNARGLMPVSIREHKSVRLRRAAVRASEEKTK